MQLPLPLPHPEQRSATYHTILYFPDIQPPWASLRRLEHLIDPLPARDPSRVSLKGPQVAGLPPSPRSMQASTPMLSPARANSLSTDRPPLADTHPALAHLPALPHRLTVFRAHYPVGSHAPHTFTLLAPLWASAIRLLMPLALPHPVPIPSSPSPARAHPTR